MSVDSYNMPMAMIRNKATNLLLHDYSYVLIIALFGKIEVLSFAVSGYLGSGSINFVQFYLN